VCLGAGYDRTRGAKWIVYDDFRDESERVLFISVLRSRRYLPGLHIEEPGCLAGGVHSSARCGLLREGRRSRGEYK
jgi:hypothetical protein